MSSKVPRVVIIGGGFGGLYAAKQLRKAPVEVVLVDRRNHHLFQPLLYQVATAGLAATDIASPIRKILGQNANTTVVLAEVTRIDGAAKQLHLDNAVDGKTTLDYDFLVLATGVRHDYFGHPEWEAFAPGLKSLEDAMNVRQRVLLAFEAAERDPDHRAAFLTFVVVGAGPTGVETAGALAEIARQTLAHDFRRIDPRTSRIILVEGGSRVLASYSESLSATAKAALERIGVEVRLGERVTEVSDHGVTLGTGEQIGARTIVWAAGIAASPLTRSLDAPLDKLGRVQVSADLSVPSHPEIFVVGDLLALAQDGKQLPGVAPAAMQSGRLVAANILHRVRGEPTKAFHYVDKGSLATIGRKQAIAEVGRFKLSGLLAWIMWLFIHILFLIGFKNRISVFLNWAWAYFTYQRGARIVLTEGSKRPAPKDAPGDTPP